MSTRILVFYADKLYADCENRMAFDALHIHTNAELYNGAYLYDFRSMEIFQTCPWYRANGTPVLNEDVPKILKLSVLLLT